MDETIEIRLKYPGQPWEELVAYDPTCLVVNLDVVRETLRMQAEDHDIVIRGTPEKSMANAIAAGIAAAEGVEVRWNWLGSLQGHYTEG